MSDTTVKDEDEKPETTGEAREIPDTTPGEAIPDETTEETVYTETTETTEESSSNGETVQVREDEEDK
jgi:hypothetical protein